jgi:hypothetical protein
VTVFVPVLEGVCVLEEVCDPDCVIVFDAVFEGVCVALKRSGLFVGVTVLEDVCVVDDEREGVCDLVVVREGVCDIV